MRLGLISDVHANREALEVVLKQLRDSVDEIVCLGDIVGYGPDPIECVEKIRAVATVCLRGNHEDGLLENLSHQNFNDDALRALQWQRRQLNGELQAWLESLPIAYTGADFFAVHGAPPDSNTDYLLTKVEAQRALRFSNRQFCFVGHTHLPMMFVAPSATLNSELPVNFVNPTAGRRRQRFLIGDDERLLINPGSVGQPRDGCPLASYCILDTDQRWIEFRRIEYPIEPVQERIRQLGLPTNLANRLAEGT